MNSLYSSEDEFEEEKGNITRKGHSNFIGCIGLHEQNPVVAKGLPFRVDAAELQTPFILA
jgi:hypothetical protein